MPRRDNLLPLALIVSALLFLMACPFKTGGAGASGTASSGTDSTGNRPVIHYFSAPYRAPHETHTRVNLPKPHRVSAAPLPSFFDQRPAGTRRPTPW